MPDRVGPRSEALRSKRAKARRKIFTAGGAAGIVAGVLAAGAIAYLATDDRSGGPAAPEPSPSIPDTITSTLVFGSLERGGPAVWLTLITHDREDDTASVVYIPSHTAVEVPGRGLQGLGDAMASGGPALMVVSAENLLGIEIDNYLDLSDRDARVLFEATGPISVDVPAEVKVAAGKDRARLLLDEGLQRLGASFLVELLYVRGLDSDDVELGSRHLAFWDALFTTFEEEPENLGAAVRSAGGSLVESNADPGDHARLLENVAALDRTARTITTLPVSQVSVGGSELYSVDPAEVAALIEDLGIASGVPRDEVRVQVLNGNGIPGIGQEVAEVLIGAGFRVVLTGNARRMNYESTLIITYDDSEQGLALAERARRLVGVGEVQISEQSQGIVDLTVVIGKDFLRTR